MEEITRIDLEGSGKSPHVDFNHLTGELILSGRSIPENAAKVYEPLLEWIACYIKSPRQTTNLRINLEYYNTPTAIWLAKIIRVLSGIKRKDSVLIIHVYFETEDFEDMEPEDIKDIVTSLIDSFGEVQVSIGMKIYGVDTSGKVVKESTILF
jgi:hypothetical protein